MMYRKGYTNVPYPIFDINEFPLRICINSNFSTRKKDLIRKAVDIWNDEYKKYKEAS